MAFTASVISAKEWGARAPKQWPEETRPQYVVIHHTDMPNPPKDLSRGTVDGAKQLARSIQGAHMGEFAWNDSGHNFLNTTGGVLLEGRQGSLNAIKRGRCVRSAHAGSVKGNESPGIENEGNFMTYQMNAKQWESLVELCASICSSCKIDPDNIKGHRDFSPTNCPGNWLYSQLPRLRQDVRKRMGAPIDDYLREGATGAKVKELQERLKAQGFNPGPIDSIFGIGTVQAVISFQKYHGLDPDGVVGPTTWKLLTSTPIPKEESRSAIDMLDTYLLYRSLPHQNQAIQWLQGKVSKQVLEEFSRRWGNQLSASPVPSSSPSPAPSLSPSPSPSPAPSLSPSPSLSFLPLREGAKGAQVKQLQERLQQLGFKPGIPDGDFGPATKSAVSAFQKSKGLITDGIVGERTWTALNLT
jgi:peptidoglycan hydrolase-like protein with peptidoglycan-binding domain